jgi:transcriptional regulator with XRE-family HTH domain
MTQEVLCARARVSRAVLSKLESERGEPVQTDVIERLLAALGMTVTVGPGAAAGVKALERLRHRQIEQERRERHLRLALDLSANPGKSGPKIRRALRQVDLWQQSRSCSRTYIERWRKVLSLDPRGIAMAMTSFGEWENAMYQNSPWSFLWT